MTSSAAPEAGPYSSLSEALRHQGIPFENHATIRAFCEAIGISKFLPRADHIKALRAAGGPPLRIHWGWTRGFLTREEALETATGCLGAVASGDLWYVAHPENRLPEFYRGPRLGIDMTECPVCRKAVPVVGGRLASHGLELCQGSRLDLSLPEPAAE